MKKQFLSALAAAALMATLAPAAMAQNIAIVNGQAVTKARVDALAQQLARSGRPITPEMQGELKNEVITREILMQEAQKRGFDTSEAFKNQMELARQSILINELFTDYLKTNPITEDDVKAEYARFVAANAGKEYRARHILVEKEDQAKDVIAKLKKGAKFEDLAKKLSKDPGSGANGGDLDWAPPTNYVKEFSEALVGLTKGKLTETPVKSQFGYHVIRLDDIRDIALPKYDDVKAQIAQQLPQQKVAKFREELRAKAKIE